MFFSASFPESRALLALLLLITGKLALDGAVFTATMEPTPFATACCRLVSVCAWPNPTA